MAHRTRRIVAHLPKTENSGMIMAKEKLVSNRPALGDIGNNVLKTVKVDYFPLKGAISQSSNKDGCSKTHSKTDKPKEEPKQNLKPIYTINVKNDTLPRNVENIDKHDSDNIFLLPEYVNEIYDYLQLLEVKYPINEDFLARSNISSRMRALLVDWLVEVQVQFNLLLETLHLTVGILDRYLQEVSVVQKEKLQLVGISAMFIACKFEETYPLELDDLIYVSDSAYTSKEILSMEMKILKKLQFSLSRPISLVFLRRFSKAAKAQAIHHAFGKYFLELALLEYSLAHIKPSLLAATALFIAHCVVGEDISAGVEVWTPTLCYFSKYKYSDMEPIIPVLANVIKQTHSSRFLAIPKKYSSSKQLQVSQKRCIAEDSDVLNQLCAISLKSS